MTNNLGTGIDKLADEVKIPNEDEMLVELADGEYVYGGVDDNKLAELLSSRIGVPMENALAFAKKHNKPYNQFIDNRNKEN